SPPPSSWREIRNQGERNATGRTPGPLRSQSAETLAGRTQLAGRVRKDGPLSPSSAKRGGLSVEMRRAASWAIQLLWQKVGHGETSVQPRQLCGKRNHPQRGARANNEIDEIGVCHRNPSLRNRQIAESLPAACRVQRDAARGGADKHRIPPGKIFFTRSDVGLGQPVMHVGQI